MSSALVPSVSWLAGYKRPWLRADVLAGLTTAAVVIPKAMAYATIAGLPVEVGLYTVLVPMVVYAVLGTSRPLSVSTSATLGILCASELADVVPHAERAALITAASTLAMLVGAILVLARLLRLGFVANFISDPVLTGFKAGVGLVVVLDQAPKLLGVHYDKVGWVHDAAALVRHVPETSMPTLAVGIATLGIILGLEHFAPQLPSPLFVVGGGIAASFFLGLQSSGVAVVGHIPSGLPPLVRPDLSLLAALWPGAMAIALMSFTETIAAGRAFVAPGEPRPNPNQELVATGAANMLGGLFAAMPGGRRHLADGGQQEGRGPHANRERGVRGGGPGHPPFPGADRGPHTPGDAGGRGHRILDRPHQPRGVPQDPAIPDPGVPVGPRGVRGGGAAGNPQGNSGRCASVDVEPSCTWPTTLPSTRWGGNGARTSSGPCPKSTRTTKPSPAC